MVTVTGGRLPAPSFSTTFAGTSMPVAVLPPSSTVLLNFMRRILPSEAGSDADPQRPDVLVVVILEAEPQRHRAARKVARDLGGDDRRGVDLLEVGDPVDDLRDAHTPGADLLDAVVLLAFVLDG